MKHDSRFLFIVVVCLCSCSVRQSNISVKSFSFVFVVVVVAIVVNVSFFVCPFQTLHLLILFQAILGSIHSPELESRNPTIAFNLIFQFLFFELRNANRVRKWFHRKLSLELDELITKTTTGKLFEKLSVSLKLQTRKENKTNWISCIEIIIIIARY